MYMYCIEKSVNISIQGLMLLLEIDISAYADDGYHGC